MKVGMTVGVAALMILGGLGVISYYNPPKVDSWATTMKGIGTSSSPRMADLTGDGVLDVIIGAGREELHPSDTAVIALDGANGKLLWHVGARDQIVGSAALYDVTDDGVVDVFIGGRSAELMAIDGKNGHVLWEFYAAGDSLNAGTTAGLYNFYNPQRIPDQDRDGCDDLLVANGGDYLAEPNNPNRPTGLLLIVSGRTGKQLAKAAVPDGKETYLSAVVADLEGDGTLDIIYGTGGETMSGHLYRTTLEAVMRQDLSQSVVLAAGVNKGFIAPPALVDITQDGVLDIIANSVDGRIRAWNGHDNALLWETTVAGSEAYTTPAVGYFTGDDTPDFFINYGKGTWPILRDPIQVMVDGSSGKILYEDTLGRFQYASPVVVDINEDGYDEVLLSVNYVERKFEAKVPSNRLVLFDFRQQEVFRWQEPQRGTNVSSTPWVGDADQDGWLDVVYCILQVKNNDSAVPDQMTIHRLEKKIYAPEHISWGAYMGSSYDGVFRDKHELRSGL